MEFAARNKEIEELPLNAGSPRLGENRLVSVTPTPQLRRQATKKDSGKVGGRGGRVAVAVRPLKERQVKLPIYGVVLFLLGGFNFGSISVSCFLR